MDIKHLVLTIGGIRTKNIQLKIEDKREIRIIPLFRGGSEVEEERGEDKKKIRILC